MMKDKFDNKEAKANKVRTKLVKKRNALQRMLNNKSLLVDDEFENSVAHNAGWL